MKEVEKAEKQMNQQERKLQQNVKNLMSRMLKIRLDNEIYREQLKSPYEIM